MSGHSLSLLTQMLQRGHYTKCAGPKSALKMRKFLLTDKYVFSEVQEEILSKDRTRPQMWY